MSGPDLVPTVVPACAAVAAVAMAAGGRRRAAAVRATHRLADARGALVSTGQRSEGLVPRRLAPPLRLVSGLRDSGLPDGLVDRLPMLWSAALVTVASLAAFALLVSGPFLTLLLGVGATIGARVATRWLSARAVRRVEADLPLALDETVRSLRSGASLVQALGEAARLPGPLGRDLCEVVFLAVHGQGLTPALRAWAVRRPVPAVRLTVGALVLGAEAGGAQARALDGVATTLRERQQLAAEVRALASQARLSGVVLSVAPLGFAAFLAVSDGDVLRFFLHTPVGTACLAAGLGLDALAGAWMVRIARVAQC